VAVDIDARMAADVDVLGIGRAGVHADLPVDDDAAVACADEPERRPVARIFTHARADGGGAGREGEEAAGASDQHR
jgi:hypothetical protein